jgi:hypothetical protein
LEKSDTRDVFKIPLTVGLGTVSEDLGGTMINTVHLTLIDWISIGFSVIGILICLLVVGIQFRPSAYPVEKKVRIWRSILSGFMIPAIGILILVIVGKILKEFRWSSGFLILFSCSFIPIQLIVTISVYSQLGRLPKMREWFMSYYQKKQDK